MVERRHNLVLRVSDEELKKLKALAEMGGEPMAPLVRRWIRSNYEREFGDSKPTTAKKRKRRP